MTNQKLVFIKMQALGNDFMVVDTTSQSIDIKSEQVRQWADRKFGVGFDQLLLIGPSQNKNCDFYYRIFNADGSEVNQCGNGLRSLATYIHQTYPNTKDNLSFETHERIIHTKRQKNGWIQAEMGKPVFTPEKIPFLGERRQPMIYPFECNGNEYSFFVMGIGNPHAILFLDSPEQAKALLHSIGKQISTHRLFPQGSNVGFMFIDNRKKIHLWVYERGVGPTLACGSNACAAVVAGICCGKLDHSVQVCQEGGDLSVEWQGNDHSIFQLGPASYVYRGEIPL